MTVSDVTKTLESDGVVMLGKLVDGERLQRLRAIYTRALERPTWNTWVGFEQNEKWRRHIENLLIYDREFVEHALYPDVCEVLRQYIGPGFELVEARGWETITTRRDFHGWHVDAWYDETIRPRPREVKLGCYLTDVETGHFQYVRASHGADESPRHFSGEEIAEMADRIVDMKGPAGTCFLFDTSGIHRQSSPVLSKRWVVMYNYHDPVHRVGDEHLTFGRYRPLLLNAAFLGDLDKEQLRILGVGRSTNAPPFQPPVRRFEKLHAVFHFLTWARMELFNLIYDARELLAGVRRRLSGILGR
jgi:hypothetical protein